jgi:hypothetical protein
MRISRWCYLAIAAALVAAFVAPATASALLVNGYGQQFAGTAVCISCHNTPNADYNNTSHGLFSIPTADPSASSTPGAGMWPAGRIGAGATLQAPDVAFTLGAGTGLREYLAIGANVLGSVPSTWGAATMVNGLEWDPAEPTDFEYALDDYNPASNGITYGAYTCGNCHNVGWTAAGKKPLSGNFTGSALATMNAWATPAGSDPTAIASYIPGASIGCERCHGTGLAAASDAGGHWLSGVKIVGFNTPTTFPAARASSFKLLDSQVCGQCHGSFKGGNITGFTPDNTITAPTVGVTGGFVTPYYGATINANAFGATRTTDVPDQAAFEASSGLQASSKFFPNGENKSLKHVYYTEWGMSKHSWRSQLTSVSPNATAYQQTGASHFTPKTGGTQQLLCNRCHTGEGFLKRKLAVDTPAGFGNIMSTIPETTSTEGFLGQECADCHISHGAVTGPDDAVGMAVRAPEKANGAYSTNGLAKDNISICEDCHNWQMEVLANGGSVPAPTLPSILGKYVSHPQREMLHARGMLEISDADWKPSTWAAGRTDFMPGAKCEQCHMPATRSDFPATTATPRYQDRSFKRYSHRMFIMMPGDAAAWGLAPWGDSCSPCHTGETQDALQANIDNWQTTASDLSNQVTTAINNAVSRGDSTSAGDVDLLKRASANLSLFVQDTSGGVHNPPYEQAGLKRALSLANSAGGTLTVAGPNSVPSNGLFALAGVASLGDGSAASGVTLSLWIGSTKIGSTTTDANGNYAFAWASTTGQTYTVLWERSSQSVSDLTATKHVDVERVTTSLSLFRSASSVFAGRSFRLFGELTPDQVASVTIQYKKPGTSVWRTYFTTLTGADGTYSFTSATRTKGTWQFRTLFAGTAGYTPSTSVTVKVLVK